MTAAAPRTADCVVVGASFAGLACATALARAGLRVTVLEKKSDAGEKPHTTGIIVKEAIDEVALLEGLPPDMVRRVNGVRLYAPSVRPAMHNDMRHVDLAAPGYYFLTTDTPRVLRWLAGKAEAAGARMEYNRAFTGAVRTQDGFELGEAGRTRYLVGADGPRSRVAQALELGVNRKFLFGMEHEYAGVELAEPDKLHCFIDRKLAPGYIGWLVAGVGVAQAGLARRVAGGGIHTALKHGGAAGEAIGEYLRGRRGDPSGWFVRSYPRFRSKRALRWLFDRFQSDAAFHLLLRTRTMRRAAGLIYFHHKGVFDRKP